MLTKFLDCPIESGNDRYGAGNDRCGMSRVIFFSDPRIKDYRGSLIKAALLPKASLA